jgi:hypothetical protein
MQEMMQERWPGSPEGISTKPTNQEGIFTKPGSPEGVSTKPCKRGGSPEGISTKPTNQEGIFTKPGSPEGVSSTKPCKRGGSREGISTKPTNQEGISSTKPTTNQEGVSTKPTNQEGVSTKPCKRGTNQEEQLIHLTNLEEQASLQISPTRRCSLDRSCQIQRAAQAITCSRTQIKKRKPTSDTERANFQTLLNAYSSLMQTGTVTDSQENRKPKEQDVVDKPNKQDVVPKGSMDEGTQAYRHLVEHLIEDYTSANMKGRKRIRTNIVQAVHRVGSWLWFVDSFLVSHR